MSGLGLAEVAFKKSRTACAPRQTARMGAAEGRQNSGDALSSSRGSIACHAMHFIVAALGRDGPHFVLHIYSSLAEQERS